MSKNSLNKYIKLFNTIKYLKIKQVYFRLYYFSRTRIRTKYGFSYKEVYPKQINSLKFDKSILSQRSYEDNLFTFLNLSHSSYSKEIDWNDDRFGKLWSYNRSYFDYLNQENIKKDEALDLILSFVNQIESIKDGLEPFPISLRGINWIKFFSYNNINENKINNSLYLQYYMLMDNLEYHLLGNHLLENGFSLLFGAYYFKDDILYKKAKKILIEELDEQILDDGGHYELSPMYHQIMLFRVLDCINLVKNNIYKKDELLNILMEKASIMIAWLKNITYKTGEIPLLNDSAENIAPSSNELYEYAKRLEVTEKELSLKDSGYRKFIKRNYECIVDVGNIGPDYIPGHAHSDTFSFELKLNNKPFIVDTGLSTYETNNRRTVERSTYSHNTVVVNKKEQSEIWGGFRVANRAKIIFLKEEKNLLKAIHNGYKKDKIEHTREWLFEENKIIIKDSLNKKSKAFARLHFHPNITKEFIESKVNTNSKIEYFEYKYASEFNKLIKSIGIQIYFEKDLEIVIKDINKNENY